jgi:hypothetical protein
MADTFEGTFGVQEEFPLGNRDSNIDAAIAELKNEWGESKFTSASPELLQSQVLRVLDRNHDFARTGRLTTGNRAIDDKLEDTRESFSKVYSEEAIKNRLAAHIK